MQADYVLGRRQEPLLKICCLNGHLKNRREGSVSSRFYCASTYLENFRKCNFPLFTSLINKQVYEGEEK